MEIQGPKGDAGINQKWSSVSLIPWSKLFQWKDFLSWTVSYQSPLFMEFSRQEYWSGLPFPSPGDLSNLGTEPWFPELQAYSLLSEPSGKPFFQLSNYSGVYLHFFCRIWCLQSFSKVISWHHSPLDCLCLHEDAGLFIIVKGQKNWHLGIHLELMCVLVTQNLNTPGHLKLPLIKPNLRLFVSVLSRVSMWRETSKSQDLIFRS